MIDGEDEDARWAAAAVAGDDEAYRRLVQRHQGTVRSLLQRLTRGSHDAEDLAQLTFVTAWEKLTSYRGGSFRSWVSRIAYRHYLQLLRRTRPVADHCPEQTIAENPGRQLDLDSALDQLSTAQREAVLLSCLAGMSHGEIAQTTGWPLGTAKSHVARGQARLRNLLEMYANDPAE